MKIEVLGAGCSNCERTAENAEDAVAQLDADAEVVKVTDIKTIMESGVMSTPAVIIDGMIVLQGKVPTVEQMKKLIVTFSRKTQS